MKLLRKLKEQLEADPKQGWEEAIEALSDEAQEWLKTCDGDKVELFENIWNSNEQQPKMRRIMGWVKFVEADYRKSQKK